MTARTRLAASAALAAVALTAASCSTKLSTQSAPSTTVAPTTTILGASTPAQTKAADYRAQVTYLLQEQIFLLSRVTGGVIAARSSVPLGTTAVPTAASATTTTTTTAAPAAAAAAATTTTTTAAPATTTTTAAASGSTTTTVASSAAASTTTTTTAAAAAAAAGPVVPLSAPNDVDTATALDHNSTDLTDVLAEPQGYGPTFAADFYPLWTSRNNAFVQYAEAKGTRNAAGASSASAALAANAVALARLFHSHNQYLAVNTVSNPGTGVADELGVDNTAEVAFINSQAANTPTAIEDVVAAAEKMRHTSDVLSAAAAKLDPAQYPGTVLGTAANLRAALTAALVQHAELAGSTTALLATGQTGAPESAALDANTSSLANVVIVNFFDQATRVFTAIWANYVNLLRSYARAKSSGGPTPNLSGVGEQVGAFFGHQAPTINPALIASDMQQVVDGLVAVADAQGASAPWATPLRVATGFTPKLASDLSEGIAENDPTQYAP